jgi:hypothetical protein
MPQVFYDGHYATAQPAGEPTFIIPFQTDPKLYAYTTAYWQSGGTYAEIDIGSPGPYGGTYTGLVPGSMKAIGGGIIEFRREFALVPDTRSEFESYVYDYHLVFFTFGLPDFCTEGTPLLVHSRIQFDYFRTDDPGSIDLPRAPQLLKTCLGLVILGDYPTVDTPSGTDVLAEDATFKVWKPGIYERKMRFIKWISSADLIFNGG